MHEATIFLHLQVPYLLIKSVIRLFGLVFRPILHGKQADATYICANFLYIPRNPKESATKTEDVSHTHDEVVVEPNGWWLWF